MMKRPASRRRGLHATTITACTMLALQAGTASLVQAEDAASEGKAMPRTDTAFSCDPARFHHDPHYVKVRMNGDAIVSMHLLRTEDGEEVVTSYPYGTAGAIVTDDTRELCMRSKRLERFVNRLERRQRLLAWLERGRQLLPPLPGARRDRAAATGPAPDATATPSDGLTPLGALDDLQLGWVPSIGQAPEQCFNFTTAALAASVGDITFGSNAAARSVAGQTNVSASVRASYGAFNAGGTFSYSDQYKASANSGSVYFNSSVIYTLNNTYDSLTSQGIQSKAGGQFATQCGVEFMSSVPAGALVTLELTYSSSSDEASQKIAASLDVSDLGDSLKVAADVKNETTHTTVSFDVHLHSQGGGSAIFNALHFALDAKDPDGQTYIDQCEGGSGAACTSFADTLASSVTQAMSPLANLAGSVPTSQDLGNFALFPDGVHGVSAMRSTILVPAIADDPVLKPYKGVLDQYLTLLNEIATLNRRAVHLNELLSTKYPDINPEQLDLTGYLGDLIDDTEGVVSYATSYAILRTDLGNCLNATTTNVEDVCGPIINGGQTVKSAYDWYDAGHGYPDCSSGDHKEACWFLQQNTIALQYAARFDEPEFVELEMDVLYIDELPPLLDAPPPSIAGRSALVAFADRPWGAGKSFPRVSILPFANDTDLSQIYGPDPTKAFEWWGIVDDGWALQSGDQHGQRTNWTTTCEPLSNCEPTFSEPHPIGFQWSNPPSKLVDVIQTTNAIPSIFTY